MQRSEPQWKRLNYKELFQQIPFAVLSLPEDYWKKSFLWKTSQTLIMRMMVTKE